MNEKPMNWLNLKKSKCPKCNAGSTTSIPFDYDKPTDMLSCRKCDFRITQQRYSEIVSDIVNKKLKEQYSYEENND